MINVTITQAAVNAWEVWNCSVPDDFPVDADQSVQLEWISRNSDLIEWDQLADSGADAYSPESVEVD